MTGVVFVNSTLSFRVESRLVTDPAQPSPLAPRA